MELFNLKNMKTINENIKRMLNLMEAQHGVIYPLIKEQNEDYWSKLQTVDPKSKAKQKIIDYPMQELKDPNTGLTLALNDSTGGKSEFLSVGAKLWMYYNVNVGYQIAPSNSMGTSRFNYYAEFYINSTGASKPATMAVVNAALLKSGKYAVVPLTYINGGWTAQWKSMPVYPAKDSNDTSYLKKVNRGDLYNNLGNFITYRLLPGYKNYTPLNDIVTKMNTELDAAGFQQISYLSKEEPK
jgi:hypothetical protein